ncbi:hypothetical protein GGI12_005847, partial [Dipsacomyces acuminosporus]
HSAGYIQDSPAASQFPGHDCNASTHSVVTISSASKLRQRAHPRTPVAQPADRVGRHTMHGEALLVSADDAQLARAFLNPALQALPGCSLWVPMDNNRLCQGVYDEVHRIGGGTIEIVTDGTWINGKCKVEADVGFDLEDLEEYRGDVPEKA